MPQLQYINPAENYAAELNDMQYIDLPNILRRNPPKRTKKNIFVDVKMYDIPETMHRALSNGSDTYSGAWIPVRQEPRILSELVVAHTGLKLVGVAIISPSEVDPEVWKPAFARRALEAGCAGVLVDLVYPELLEDFPDRVFFSYADQPVQ
jgi:hypothetical protein